LRISVDPAGHPWVVARRMAPDTGRWAGRRGARPLDDFMHTRQTQYPPEL